MSALILRPNSTEFSAFLLYPNTGESAHEDIDEESSDEDSTYLHAGSQDDVEGRFGLPNHTTESGTINSVKVYAVVRVTNLALKDCYVKVGVYSDSTPYYSSEMDISSESYVTKSETWADNPNSEVAWTWDDIDSLQVLLYLEVGYLAGGRPPISCYSHCTQVYVEVDYTPPAGFAHSFGMITG